MRLNRAVPAKDMAPFIRHGAVQPSRRSSRRRRQPFRPTRAAMLSTYVRTHSLERRRPAGAGRRSPAASPGRSGQQRHLRARCRRQRHQRAQRHVPDVAKRSASIAKDPHSKDLAMRRARDLGGFKKQIDGATKFIPLWVKVAVAIALGLGTMVGWKRIVVTVGREDRQDPSHLCAGRLGGARGHGDDRLRPTCTDCRSRPHTCCPPGSPAPWRRTVRACRWARSAISSWPGC